MNALPGDDASFDVVTSFRGIWGTTPDAVAEAYRVLVPGGRLGLTVWGHIKVSPGAWAFAPFALAAEPKVQNQAAMVALGRPGAGEALLSEMGFTEIERIDVPFVFEFSDPDAYARALASTGPAFEAIQAVGEQSFLKSAVEMARQQTREGLPLRAPIALVGYLAVKPFENALRDTNRSTHGAAHSTSGFLAAPTHTPEIQRLFDDDLEGLGYVTNVSRLWAHLPPALQSLSDLMAETTHASSISFRQRAVLVTAAASALGDSYCSMAWGKKLAEAASPEVAAAVIEGGAGGLGGDDKALAQWARLIARDPNAITGEDVEALRKVGFHDGQIFAITAFVAFRLAFAAVNDALGAVPDIELRAAAPEPVRSAVAFGRLPAASKEEE
jgi:alkylhydroperoxidase family enzyme